ncbi:MAG: helix-turn-helix domain-containing protein [Xanthomonadales bacterium]|nr:helix-turn-helix domain-containing protein [Xanthomonadales bacterium]
MALSIGRLSERARVKIETIRYYEKEGLMPDPPRSLGGHRQYLPDHVERLAFIRRSRELGFSLDEVRQLLVLYDGRGRCDEVRRLAEHHLDDVRGKIRDLRRLERSLSGLIGRCRDTPDDECPVIDALRLGTDPH